MSSYYSVYWYVSNISRMSDDIYDVFFGKVDLTKETDNRIVKHAAILKAMGLPKCSFQFCIGKTDTAWVYTCADNEFFVTVDDNKETALVQRITPPSEE